MTSKAASEQLVSPGDSKCSAGDAAEAHWKNLTVAEAMDEMERCWPPPAAFRAVRNANNDFVSDPGLIGGFKLSFYWHGKPTGEKWRRRKQREWCEIWDLPLPKDSDDEEDDEESGEDEKDETEQPIMPPPSVMQRAAGEGAQSAAAQQQTATSGAPASLDKKRAASTTLDGQSPAKKAKISAAAGAVVGPGVGAAGASSSS